MNNLTKHSELKNTIELMISEDYKKRFLAEYYQVLIRYTKLDEMLNKIYHGKIVNKPVPHDCPVELLEIQSEIMRRYLDVLKIRAKIEGIDL